MRTTGGFEMVSFDSLKAPFFVARFRRSRRGRRSPSALDRADDDARYLFKAARRRSEPEEPSFWQGSRFALDLPSSAPKGRGSIAVGTYKCSLA